MRIKVWVALHPDNPDDITGYGSREIEVSDALLAGKPDPVRARILEEAAEAQANEMYSYGWEEIS